MEEYRIKENSNIDLKFQNIEIPVNGKILIIGNTEGYFGYIQEDCFDINKNAYERFRWFLMALKNHCRFTILCYNKSKTREYYKNLFGFCTKSFGLKSNVSFYDKIYNDNDFLEIIKQELYTMKFDICLMNPPYGNGLYKKFLLRILKISNRSVSIHPVDFLIGKRPNKDILKILKNGFNLQIVNSMSDFDAGIWGTLGILTYNGNGQLIYNGRTFDAIEDIKPWSDDEFLEEFIKNIKELFNNDNLDNHLRQDPIWWAKSQYKEDNPNNSWWCMKIPQLRGHQSKKGVCDDYYTFIPNDRVPQQYKDLEKKGEALFYFAFDSLGSCQNFINYLKSDFARTALKTIKTTGQLMRGELKRIPWFDFSDSHFSKSPREIDNWLFAKYNISNDIRKHIEEILPDYYGIRK